MAENAQRPEGPLAASVERLRHELDRWLEAAFSQGERALDAFGLRGTWCPGTDLIEGPNEVRVVVDLPGVDPAGLDISLAGNMLTIQGKRAAAETVEGEVVHLRQRVCGQFSRSIPMPAPVSADAVSAELKHGVLTIRMPKAEHAKPRHIRVRPENEAGGMQI